MQVIIMRDLKGKKLDGKKGSYILEERLKGGGFGDVWTAQSLVGGVATEKVAVKMLSEKRRTDIRSKELFYEEGRNLLVMPPHDNILRPQEIVSSEGDYYLVMPLMQKSLQDYIDAGTNLSGNFVRCVLKGVGKALAHAHTYKMIHRDVHPGNILFEEVEGKGKVYLSDFGLARVLQESPLLQRAKEMSRDSSKKSLEVQLGQVSGGRDSDEERVASICYGLVTYASPEVLASSLGVEAATELSDQSSLSKVGHVINQNKDRRLQDILERGMHIIPKKRYSSVTKFVDAIKGLKDYLRKISAVDPKTLDEKKAAELYQLVQEAYETEPWNKAAFGEKLTAIDEGYGAFKEAWLLERIAGKMTEDLQKDHPLMEELGRIQKVTAELHNIESFYK